MPIYEFHCSNCEQDSEVLVRSTRWEGQARCPHCGSEKLAKRLSTFASSVSGQAVDASCSGNPRSCGMCGTGKAHSH